MNQSLKIIKIIGLVLFLVGATIAFLFFRAWQSNQRPEMVTSSWENELTTIGHVNTLHATLRVPWHRELLSAEPRSHPSFLPPVPDKAVLKRDRLSLNGYRQWTVTIPLVPTDAKSVQGLTLSLPLRSIKRPSSNSVSITLPDLEITTPGNLPKIVSNPREFAKEDLATAEEPVSDTQKGSPWLLIVLVLLALGSIIFIYLRSVTKHAHTNAWEEALQKISLLEKEKDLTPDNFFSRLTDILKSYTGQRFHIPATTKTSSEFLASVYGLEDVPEIETMELPWLSRLADDIKFAGISPAQKDPAEALALVRNFITKTKPAPVAQDDA